MSNNTLLSQIKSPEFELTLVFEKRLAETFCKNLHNVIESKYSTDSVAHFGKYLDCVLAVADKDEKFIQSYFANLECIFYEKLTTFISNTHIPVSFICGLYK